MVAVSNTLKFVAQTFAETRLNNVGLDTQFDGLTTVLQASATGLGTGTNNVVFAIADAGDPFLDSAVFIDGSSFTAVDPQDPPQDPTPVSEPGTLALLGMGLMGFVGTRRRMLAKA